MSTGTSIEWTDATWNPTRGCSRVSEGCRNCYAERLAARMSKPGMWGHGLASMSKSGPRWTGRVGLVLGKLAEPLRWREPQKVFVNSMSDLFHETLDYNDIAAVYGVMAAAPHHTFQVLTKRPERRLEFHDRLGKHPLFTITSALSRQRVNFPRALQLSRTWPLPNVWEGVSVEDQATADERIPLLLRTPASVRFVSYEPALDPVSFYAFLSGKERDECLRILGQGAPAAPGLDWVIVGGESGPGARPFSLRWARSVVKQCREAGTKVFVKQLGARPCAPSCASPECDHPDCDPGWLKLRDRKGGDWSEWPADLRVRESPA